MLGARRVNNPMWLRKRIITAHPVGGAPMGRDPSAGVCDPYGEVFGYPGLYIADGAAMPGPVGPNPSLTIAALADRMCTRLLEKPPATVVGGADLVRAGSAAAGPVPGAPGARPGRTSLSFTEEMSGTCFPGVGGQGARDETGRQQHDDRRDAQPARQYLGADREHEDKANADQDLVCRHATLPWPRVGLLFARRSLFGGQHRNPGRRKVNE